MGSAFVLNPFSGEDTSVRSARKGVRSVTVGISVRIVRKECLSMIKGSAIANVHPGQHRLGISVSNVMTVARSALHLKYAQLVVMNCYGYTMASAMSDALSLHGREKI